MHIELAQSQSSRLNKPIVFLGAILVLVFFSYIAALNNDFVNWDDGPHLVDNLSVRSLSLENIKNIFKSTISKTYIPLTTLSWAVEYSFIKYNPFYYHLNNLLLHLANVVLIFTLARQIGLSYLASGFASLLWGIHPMHVESVVWVTQRKDVLFTFFYLLGLNSYWRYLKKGRMALYFLTLVFGFLSILAKAMALSFPVVLVLCDYLYRRKKSLGLILEKVPFFCYVIPITWITLSANTNIMAVDQNFGQSILTFLWTFIFYLKKFAWPQWLGPAYTLPDPISLGNSAFLISVIGFVLLLGAIIVFRRKKLFIFSLFFYSVTIFPILRYEYIQYLSFVADRFMYLPSVGVCLYVGYLGAKIFRWLNQQAFFSRIIGKFVYILVFLILSVRTYHQCDVWQNSETMWTHLIQKEPRMFIPFLNRGVHYMENKRYDEALLDFNRVIELTEDDDRAFNNRGLIYFDNNLLELALKDFNQAILINPRNKSALNNRGLVYRQQQKLEAALADFTVVLAQSPQDYIALDNRAKVYIEMKEYDLALDDLNSSLKINPDYESAFFNRGVVYNKIGEYAQAAKDFTRVIKLNAGDAKAYNNRAMCLFVLGDYPAAVNDLSASIQLDPDNGGTYFNRAVCLKALQRYQDAYVDVIQAKVLGYETDKGFVEEIENLIK